MADTEEPQFNTLKERIAALNQQKNFNSTGNEKTPAPAPSTTGRRPPPPPPPGRPVKSDTRSQTVPVTANGNGAATDGTGSNGSNDSQPPPRAAPAIPQRPNKSKPMPPPLPRRDTQGSQSDASQPSDERRAPPPLPTRTNTGLTPPTTAPILPRRTSHQLLNERRGSASSEMSQRSTASNVSQTHTISSVTSHGSDGRKMAPAYNPASLPPLPPSKREREAKAQQEAAERPSASRSQSKPPLPTTRSSPAINTRPTAASQPSQESVPQVPKRNLPPMLPGRPAPKVQVSHENARPESTSTPPPALPSRNQAQTKSPSPEPQQNKVLKHASIMGFDSGSSRPRQNRVQDTQPEARKPPPIPSSSHPSTTNDDDAPPPIPTSSRPTASQIDAANARASAPRPTVQQQQQDDCWTCRDWSGPDGVAAQFPRDSLPRKDPVGHLAHGLCSPFPSYTDKARAIFTWFHHNIYYDTVSFFNKNVKHMSVEDTLFTGKAVCQGYAETYKAIANRAGLDCVMVTGHGKGFGHTPLKPGERPPPAKPDGHAWNAVRIDGGSWKLLDACWGAGHICGETKLYKQKFAPKQFTSPNDEFGERHFPKDPQQQFRDDGRIISWDEYFVGRGIFEPPVVYTTGHEEGILERSVEPRERKIPVNAGGGNEVVRIQFSKLCPHWRSETHGKGEAPLWMLQIHGVDGRKDDMVPIETDGYWHTVDVRARDLGAPGQTLQVAQITKIGGKDVRGITYQEYASKKGKASMAWTYVLKWELV